MAELLGRAREVGLVRTLLGSSRLVTITGAPGIGKSSVARAATDAMSGVRRVEGLRALRRALREADPKERIELFVVDDLEPRTPEVRTLVQALLRRGRVLVTGSAPLDLRAEGVVRLRGLGVEAAVKLLVSRGGGDRLTTPDAAPYAALADALDRNPAALEGMAERIGHVDGALLVEEALRDPIAALARPPGAPAIRDRFVQSLRWLPPAAERALHRLSAFEGGLRPRLAERVLREPEDLRSSLDALIDRGLLEFDPTGGSFRVLRLARAFARSRASASSTRKLFALHAQACIDAHDVAPSSVDDVDLSAIIDRAVAPDADKSLRELGARAALRVGLDEATISSLLRKPALLRADTRARLLAKRAQFLVDAAKPREAVRALSRAMALSRETKDRRLEGELLVELGLVHHRAHRLDEARAMYERALSFEALEAATKGRALCDLAAIAQDQVRFDEARALYERAMVLVAGHPRIEGVIHMNLGVLAQEEGDLAAALRTQTRALALLEEAREHRLSALARTNLGAVLHESGDLEGARARHALALDALAHTGDVRSVGLCRLRLSLADASLGRTREALDGLHLAEIDLRRAADEDALACIRLAAAYAELCGADSPSTRRAAQTALAAVQRSSGDVAGPATRSDDVRFVVRVVERALARGDGDELVLRFDPSTSEVCAPHGSWSSLASHRAYWRMLVELVERRREQPGRGIALEELWTAGWPGERAAHGAWQNRVYVGLSFLRANGLRRWILRREDGYLLDPAIVVVQVDGRERAD